jgi:hypothetical protein
VDALKQAFSALEDYKIKLVSYGKNLRESGKVQMGQPELGGLAEGLRFLLQNWDHFEQWPSLPQTAKDGQPVLQRCLEIALSLQQAAIADQVRQQIQAIDKDILGTYSCPPGLASSVELYRLPIAMVAAMLDVSIEDLTVVVLIHELAHGYTHLGRDIDGTRWEDLAFRDSALEVVEGLAQFYTEVISERLAPRTPSLKTAYERLLSLQNGPYLAHQEWLNGEKRQRGEIVRFTLIAARAQGRIDYSS